VEPNTPIERWVAATWSDVLGVNQPKLGDNFVALGGHSLHAVRMVFLLRAALGVPVHISVIFDTADLGELCRWLASRLAEQGREPDFSKLPTHPAVPAAPSQPDEW
jgi:hypothetical protein